MQPLVSVVVPVFNGLPYLESLMDALERQTYPNIEIVVSEGGGTDGSLAYLQSLDIPNLSLATQPRGTSAADNWTAATRIARGDFIKLVCQDDMIFPDAITQQVGDLLAHPSAVMATARRDIIDAHGTVVFRDRGLAGVTQATGTTMAGSDLIRRCYLAGTNIIGEPLAVLFRADVLQAAMPWRDDNPLMLDLSTYERVAPLGDVVIRRNSVGAFRVSSQSWSTGIAGEQLRQTRAWQHSYERAAQPKPSPAQRLQAKLNAYRQVNLRRAAYTFLRVRGSLS